MIYGPFLIKFQKYPIKIVKKSHSLCMASRTSVLLFGTLTNITETYTHIYKNSELNLGKFCHYLSPNLTTCLHCRPLLFTQWPKTYMWRRGLDLGTLETQRHGWAHAWLPRVGPSCLIAVCLWNPLLFVCKWFLWDEYKPVFISGQVFFHFEW